MDGQQVLADRFEEHRSHLRAVAYRILGSANEADDAVQEAWLRLSGADAGEIANLGGWLTTVTGRICLNMLRSRGQRREESLDVGESVPDAPDEAGADPEARALLDDSVGGALLVVLDTLAPAERLAFVLHDLFAVPFDDIAPIVERSTAATRQLASRARRRVQGASPAGEADRARRRRVVDAWMAATRAGRFEALLELLDPDVLLRVDFGAAQAAGASEVRGALAVLGQAKAYAQMAPYAHAALVDGAVGMVAVVDGRAMSAMTFALHGDRIVAIDILADLEEMAELDYALLD